VAETGAGQEAKMAEGPEPAWQARTLLRAARSAVLATSAEGQPYAALVTPAFAPDLAALLWLSRLSDHTRHLAAEPLCALLVQGTAEGPNPQTAPRVTLTGRAERIEDQALKARWLAIHPYAALYADFADFSLWRIVPGGAHLVGGFARAFRLPAAKLLPDAAAITALWAAEHQIISHCNVDHADAMKVLGEQAAGGGGEWRMVAVDTDGFDLADDIRSVRIAWSAPVVDAQAVRNELVTMLRRMREG
jgi:putative heme iron utilization protein